MEPRTHATAPAPIASLLELSRLAQETATTMAEPIERAAALVAGCLRGGGKVLTCGNGGSAADAQHMAGELIGRFLRDRPAMPAVTLSADTSVLTSLANDYGFETIFARQVEGLGAPGDVLVGFSTSGRSPNVLRAIEAAHKKGLKTIALVGPDTNAALDPCDVVIRVAGHRTPIIQEIHTAILHAICERVENALYPPKTQPE